MLLAIWIGIFSHLVNGEKFPIHEFMNTSLEADLDRYMCSSDIDQKCCYCSEGCMENKDCCIDYLWKEKSYKSLKDYIKYFLQESSKYKDRSCVQLVPNQESQAYYMVTTCDTFSSTVEWKRCTDIDPSQYDTFLPVVDRNNILYRNIYCAQCNQVSSFKHLTVSAYCKKKNTRSNHTMTILETFTSCTFSLNFDAEQSCYIKENLNRDCELTNSLYQLCRSYQGQIEYSYANYHCFQCNNPSYKVGDNFDTNFCPPKRGPPVASKYGWSITLSYSGYASIKNLNRFDEDFLKEEEVKVCSKNESYDIIQKKCLPITCIQGYQYNIDICEKVLQPETDFNVVDARLESCLAESRASLFVQVKSENFNDTFIEKYFKDILDSDKETFDIYSNLNQLLTLKWQLPLNYSQYKLLKMNLLNSTHDIWKYVSMAFILQTSFPIFTQYNSDILQTFSEQKLCYDMEHLPLAQVNFTTQCSFRFKNLTFPWQNASSVIVFRNNSMQKNMSICRTYYLQSTCKLLKVTSNFSLESGVLSVRQGSKSITFQPSEYTLLQTGFGVCSLRAIENSSWRETLTKVEYFIAVIGSSISIVCYLIILLTYGYYKELQNVPGMCLIALSTVLLLADISFLVGVHNNEVFTLCKCFAVLLHWSMLSTLMWSIMISYNIAIRFSSFSASRSSNSKKTILRFCLLAFGLPSLIVTLTLVLNETNTAQIGYGINGICWIGEFYALLGFYIIPAASGYLLTMFGLLYTLHNIFVDNKKSNQVLQNSGREKVNLLKIALKLVCILGVSEGIGFIQIHDVRLSNDELIFNAVFGVCYTVLRSIRGLLLVIVYIFTNKVFELYKKTLTIKKKNTHSKSAKTTETLIPLNNISSN